MVDDISDYSRALPASLSVYLTTNLKFWTFQSSIYTLQYNVELANS